MRYLTGNLTFTTEIIVFEDYIQEWKNKEIIYCYYGYGGQIKPVLNAKTLKFEHILLEIEWEDGKMYKGKITNVSQNTMFIELDSGYKFKIFAEDFRRIEVRDKFDICEP